MQVNNKKTSAIFAEVFCLLPFVLNKGVLPRNNTFLDTCFFTGKGAQVENTGAAHFTALVEFDFLERRHVEREYTLYAYRSRHLADGESFRNAFAANLYHHATEKLRSGLVAFPDLVVNGDGVTGAEFREIFLLYKSVLYVLY